MSELSRRALLKGGSMIAVGLVAPRWLSSIAQAETIRIAKGGKATSDTILVVCQFTGGNDGLNTLVPYSNSLYYQNRPQLALKENDVLKVDENLAFHPALAGLAELYKQKKVAVIQNVGYPDPNRSHFRSMEIWQSASPDSRLKYGWLGRHFDHALQAGPLNPVVGLGLSTEKPLSLNGQNISIPCFASLADINSMVGDPETEKMLRAIQGMAGQGAGSVVQKANNTALDAMNVLKAHLGTYTPTGQYANEPFGQGFKQIAQLVATSPATRVIYFSAGGFDTHARQADTHQQLLKGFGDAVSVFQKEMESIGKADKVIVMVFSEFGRRVAENSSAGTDHGAAAPMFLIGKSVKGGLYGKLPDLSNLNAGDLQYDIDFRQVYATALDQWIGGDSEITLGQKFEGLPVF